METPNKIIILIVIFITCYIIIYHKPITKFLYLRMETFTNNINNNSLSLTNVFDKCYVINLHETPEGQRRWKVLQKHPILAKYINRFPGIYGATYNYQQEINEGIIYAQWDFGSWHKKAPRIIDMDPGEIGCILSHRNVWKKIVNDKLGSTLILEDDAINTKKNFIDIITNLMNHVPKDWDIFLLGFWLHRGDNGKKINQHIHSVGDFCLLHSYLVSQRGAQKLLSLGTIDMPLDSWISSQSSNLNIYRHNIVRANTRNPVSSLIRQYRKEKQIKNTNNW